MASVDPMVSRRRLAMTLRQERRRANKSQKDVALHMDWATSKVIRIELAESTVTPVDVRALLAFYEVTDEARVDELVELARASRRPTWWSPYRQWLSPEFIRLLGYEASATAILTYELALVPGLLQTEEYTRELLRAYRASRDINEEEIDQLVAVRRERQEQFLNREDPPELTVYIDEAVLWRRLSTVEATGRQLEHLRDMARRPNVHLFVVPATSRLHPALSGPLLVLEFESHEEDVLFLERKPGSSIIRDDPAELARARVALAVLAELVLTEEEMDRLFDTVISELRTS